jgi:SNF2 family DNA or RNA helicase
VFLSKINLKNPYISNLIPDDMREKEVSELNKYIWEQQNLDLLKKLVNQEEGRLSYFKDSPLTNIKELLKYSDIVKDKLSNWDKEFLSSVQEQDILSIKQRALCLKLINGINYAMWKSGLTKKWLIDEYNKLEKDDTVNISSYKVIDLDNVKEEELTDDKSLIVEFELVKESFDDIMESKLFDHQVLRVNFFLTRDDNSAIEASSVGSGKTITGLTYAEQLYLENKIKHTYIICPLVMVETWKKEIIKHTKAKDLSKYTILNYEKITKYDFKDGEDCLLIMDEAHRLKNSLGQRFKYLSNKKFKYVLPMSATIIGNSYEELKAIYKLMNKKIPLRYGKLNLKELKKDLIRISSDKLNLPNLIIKEVPLEVGNYKEYLNLQNQIYAEIKEDKEMALKSGKRPPNELVKLLRLNQYSSDRNIVMEKEVEFVESNKFKALMEILSDNTEEQFIIWSNFVLTVKNLNNSLSEYYDCKSIYGDIKQEDRDKILDDFRNKKFKILIANPSTLNAGVTLVNATRMVYFDRDFSSIKYIQSRGRFHRIGQNKECIMYNLYYSNTIEEKIIEILKLKESMINEILESGQKVDDNLIKDLLKKDIYKGEM